MNYTSPIKIGAILVEFQTDENNSTSGDGSFLVAPVEINLDDRSENFIIDQAPHNADYFRSQLNAVKNYFSAASDGNIEISLENSWISQIYTLSEKMEFYNPVFETDDQTPFHLELVEEAINLASADTTISDFDVIVIFHAGVGQDFAIPLDPTPFDLPSSFFDASDLADLDIPSGVENVILLPETQNHALFPEEDSYYDFQVGLTGTFALLFGYFLGLPAMFDTETGTTGIGYWGLMDQGSNNLHGICPALPNPWTRALMSQTELTEISSGLIRLSIGEITKIPINESEYFLTENRSNKSVENYDFEMVKIGSDSLFVVFENGVVTRVSNYDSGIPGSGILIWHIDESVIAENLATNTINGNPDRRGIDLEEADGSQDLGENYGFFFPGGTENGWQWDAWYAKNPAYFHLNSDIETDADSVLVFDSTTHPNTDTNDSGKFHSRIRILDEIGDEMRFTIEDGWQLEVFETDEITDIWQSPVFAPIYLDSIGCCFSIPSPPFGETNYDLRTSFADLDNDGDLEKIIVSDTELSVFNENGTLFPNFPIALPDSGVAAASVADFDFDNICEIFVGTKNGLIIAYDLSGNVVSGFPISMGGESITQPAVGVCNGQFTIANATISGNVFIWKTGEAPEEDVRIPWGQFGANAERNFQAETPNGEKEIIGKLIPDLKKVFCYPNPAKESTTIRYFVEDAESVEIAIFTLSGRKIATFENTDITQYEFNETVWNLAEIESDVYFAKITAKSGARSETAIVKIGIAK